MYFSKEIVDTVWEKIQSGYSKQSLFIDLCHKFDYTVPPLQHINEWVERFESSDVTLCPDFGFDYFSFLFLISNKVQLSTNGILHRPYLFEFTLAHLNSRYAFAFSNSSLMILDCFTGKEMKLTNPDKSFDYNSFLPDRTFALISSNRLLLCLKKEDDELNYTFLIQLLSIDLKENAYSTLDEYQVELSQAAIIFDTLDSKRFIITGSFAEDYKQSGLIGQILDDKIVIESKLYFSLNLKCQRLVGNQLSGIRSMFDKATERRKHIYREYKLNGEKFELLSQFEFVDEDELGPTASRFEIINYAWHGEICYIALSQFFGRYHKIYQLDTKSQQFSNSCVPGFMRMYDLKVNANDGSLIIMSTNDEVFRYPLSQPDPLETISFFKWRRKQLTFKNYVNDENLPENSKYQHFYGLN